jgi:3-oxoacyl-[acyl-carrier-protein] synthase-3
MHNDVFINRVAKLLPNDPVSNDEMEGILGQVGERPSRARKLVLRQNGITRRFYVLNKQGEVAYNNSQLTAAAIRGLLDEDFTLEDIELLCCGTTSPDQLAPPHAVMVHGELKCPTVECVSTSGVCSASMQALKHGFLSVAAGVTRNAIATGSETSSLALQAKHYRPVVERLEELDKTPILAFERDFLRWMLSDGAAAVLLEDRRRGEVSLKVEWVDGYSYAHELETCMYAGCVKTANGVKGWKEFSPREIMEQALFTGAQDVRLLDRSIIEYAVRTQVTGWKRRGLDPSTLDFYLPHLSSTYFSSKLAQGLQDAGVNIPQERWFTNLSTVGNVGSASILLILEELFGSGRLRPGHKVFLAVPESSRFAYYGALLTVV